MTKTQNIKRWSDNKLSLELGMAIFAVDRDEAWITKLKIESLRRCTIERAA
jgi:hypothetical protein